MDGASGLRAPVAVHRRVLRCATSYRQEEQRTLAASLGLVRLVGLARRRRRGLGRRRERRGRHRHHVVVVLVLVVVVVVEVDGAAVAVAAVAVAEEGAQEDGPEHLEHLAGDLLYLLFDYLEHTPPLAHRYCRSTAPVCEACCTLCADTCLFVKLYIEWVL